MGVLIVFTLLCVQQTSGLFFYLKEGENKCFIEDLPEHTIVVVEIEAADIPVNAAIPGTTAGEIARRKNADTQPIEITGTVTYVKETVVEQTIGPKVVLLSLLKMLENIIFV